MRNNHAHGAACSNKGSHQEQVACVLSLLSTFKLVYKRAELHDPKNSGQKKTPTRRENPSAAHSCTPQMEHLDREKELDNTPEQAKPGHHTKVTAQGWPFRLLCRR